MIEMRKKTKLEAIFSAICLGIVFSVVLWVLVKQKMFHLSDYGLVGSQNAEPEHSQIQQDMPAGLAFYTATEKYDTDTLYEKINGKAPLYTDAGFVALESTRYSLSDNSTLWFEANIYEMEDSDCAFYVFSTQRRPEAFYDGIETPSIEYRTENSYFTFAGNKYYEFIGAEASQELMDVMMQYARKLAREVGGGIPKSIKFLSNSSIIEPETVKMNFAYTFGVDGLDKIMIGSSGDNTLFWKVCKTAEQADALFAAYQSFMQENGFEVISSDVNSRFYDLFGVGEYFMKDGNVFAGIHETSDVDSSKMLLSELLKALSENSDE